MKNLALLISFFILLAMVSVTINSCGNIKTDEEIHQHIDEIPAEIKDNTYQCPMKCEGVLVYEKEGDCPVCKMDLKEIEE